VLGALQNDRLGGVVDAADSTPIAVPHPDPVFMAAQWPSRGMRPERVGGEGLDPDKQGATVSRR